MLELLSPAGSPEAVTAAVQSGADAVYLGAGDFNARRNASNFSLQDLEAAVSYCHLRGVRVYLTLNTLLTDRELPLAAETAQAADRAGVDAILVQDLGAARMLRQAAPEAELHASTQMTIHNLDGVLLAAELGMKRVVLSRELSRDQIAYICRRSPIEIEVFVHGALCMCYSGQCFFSSVIGGRSGNRGLCAQPCRLSYGWEGRADAPLLSLKDMSLAGHLRELEEIGVACIKIEGRMKRPEYVAIVTKIYAAALREGREPTGDELKALELAFSRQGFTDGYFMDRTGPDMFGVRTENETDPGALLAQARAEYSRGEQPLVPIRLTAQVRAGQPVRVQAEDEAGHTAAAEGPVPEAARTRALTADRVREQLSKTGGTPFFCGKADCQVEEGLSLPLSGLNALRRSVLEELSVQRSTPPAHQQAPYQPAPRRENRKEPPVYTVSVQRAEQITEELMRLRPALVYLPLELAAKRPDTVDLIQAYSQAAVILPRVLWDRELPEAEEQLQAARELGIDTVLAGNWGHLTLAKRLGFRARGDYGLGVTNSESLAELNRLGLLSATLSFEQRLARLRDLSKPLDTELLVYGRLPLMITENCIIKNRKGRCSCEEGQQLTDRKGARFPVVRAWGCRNEILNSKTLFLADKAADYRQIGLWAARLRFTTEEPEACVGMMKRYLGLENREPGDITRGLSYRDVE